MKKVFIGGAWPYANNSLHVGHIAALLPGDVIARYYRKCATDVLYVSGTDSHGTPITVRAKQEGIHPSVIAQKYHEEFEDCFRRLNFSYDVYSATFDKYHKEKAYEYVQQIIKNGYVYEALEAQDYCESCNQFLSDREIEGVCPFCGGTAKGDQCDCCDATFNSKELKNKTCKYCGNKVSEKLNRHLYWKLSAFQDQIESLVERSEGIWRSNAINGSKRFLKEGLRDRALTRQLDWGVEVPYEGYEDKRIYVWVEAVLGYLTMAQKWCEVHGVNWEEFSKNSSDVISYYVHGKDNIPFHTIIYPALLLSLEDDFKLPQYIISSEYLNVDNEKISKSKGNGVTAKELLNQYDSDTIRYYMIAQAPETKDSNFSYESLVQNHNKYLVGVFGNFVNRNLAYLVKKFDGVIPVGVMDCTVEERIRQTYKDVGTLIVKGELRAALEDVVSLAQYANRYYDEKKPWIQVKEDIESFNNTTYTCVNLIANLANLFEPFIPKAANTVFGFLGLNNPDWDYVVVKENSKLNGVRILFERLEV